MKKFLVFLMLLLSTSLFAQQWNVLEEPDFTSSFNDICMVSASEGWIVGNGGLIIHTLDGFNTVEVQNSNVTADINKVFFYDIYNGWAGTKKGSVLRTTDGGATWHEVSLQKLVPAGFVFAYFDAMQFVDPNVGFIVAGKSKNEYIFKTEDAGQTWAIKDSLIVKSSMYWTDIRFFDDQKGVVVGDKPETQKYTTDGGETWMQGDSTVYSPFKLSTVRWLNENELVCLGEGNEFYSAPLPVYKSSNGGKTWSVITNTTEPVYDRIKDVYFKDSINGIAVGNNGFNKFFVYKTSDGGNNWTPSVENYSCGAVIVKGFGDFLYVLGSNSQIFKSTDFGSTWNSQKLKTTASIQSISFVGNFGYAVNKNGEFYRSSDKGHTWNFISFTGVWDAYAVQFINENTGFVVKENRHIVKTTDGGNTWKTVLEPTKFNSQSKVGGISMVNETTGYAWFSIDAYTSYHFYKTTDGGDTWSEVSSETALGSSLSGNMIFFDENHGVYGTCKGKVGDVNKLQLKVTTNGGVSWADASYGELPASIAASDIKDLSKIDDNSAILVGTKYIYKTTDKGLTWNFVNHGVTDIDSSFTIVDFKNNFGVVGTLGGTIITTTDAGSTWQKNESAKGKYKLYTVSISEENIPVFGTSDGYIVNFADPTSVNKTDSKIPADYVLMQNYPNPFNPSTVIGFALKNASKVELSIYDVLGEKVASLINSDYNAGNYQIKFNASNLSSGIYFYTLKTNNISITKKMLLLK